MRTKLIRKLHQTKEPNLSSNFMDVLLTGMVTLKKTILKNEKIIKDRLRYKNFFDKVRDALDVTTNAAESKVRIIEATNQMDLVICYESNNNCCHAALSLDGDFIVNSGKKMLIGW